MLARDRAFLRKDRTIKPWDQTPGKGAIFAVIPPDG